MNLQALLVGCLLSCAVQAEPLFEYVVRSDMHWKISARPTAAERPVTVCEWTLYDVLDGERVHMEGWTQVDALTIGIGVNAQLAYCDDAEPQCNYSGRRWPGVHKWDAGNVWRVRGEHHKVFMPSADYISTHYQQAVTFNLFVNVYRRLTAGAYAGINDCAITFERHRD